MCAAIESLHPLSGCKTARSRAAGAPNRATVTLLFIARYVKRNGVTPRLTAFNGKFREERLNVHGFGSVEYAKEKIDAWRCD
jgi:hypothetical protein